MKSNTRAKEYKMLPNEKVCVSVYQTKSKNENGTRKKLHIPRSFIFLLQCTDIKQSSQLKIG